MSFKNITKSRGPSMDVCDTPENHDFDLDKHLPRITCTLQLQKDNS